MMPVFAQTFEGFPHVLESQQFTREQIEFLCRRAEEIRNNPNLFHGVLTGQRVAVVSYEPSTRTLNSCRLAAMKLGASEVHVEPNMSAFSSMLKGDNLRDTVIMFIHEFGYDWLALRWNVEGSVAEAASLAGLEHPVINMGDGEGQHPTQGMLDVYTMWREKHDLSEPMVVGMVGDLAKGRVVHSDVYLLAKWPNIKFVFISSESSRMKPGILEYLDRHGRTYTEVPSEEFAAVLPSLDVCNMTRAQLERQETEEEQEALIREYQNIILTPKLADTMKPTAIIIHPLPRNLELPPTVDSNPRARYHPQMGNGLWMRAALFSWIQDIRNRS